MTNQTPYNPLDKHNLGVSVADAILNSPVGPLMPSERFIGAGIYAIYYTGSNFPAYERVAELNRDDKFAWPIYVGKAVPEGARKGGFGVGTYRGTALYKRIVEHARSIEQVVNLDLADFHCRYLVVEDIWIPLGESLLIEKLSPVWNKAIDGFGNHDPGGNRYNQRRSPWDVIHPGRTWAMKCAESDATEAEVLVAVDKVITGFLNAHPTVCKPDVDVRE